MRHRIMVAKESERYDEDSKQSIADFEYAANITVNRASVILREKKVGMKVTKWNIIR